MPQPMLSHITGFKSKYEFYEPGSVDILKTKQENFLLPLMELGLILKTPF